MCSFSFKQTCTAVLLRWLSYDVLCVCGVAVWSLICSCLSTPHCTAPHTLCCLTWGGQPPLGVYWNISIRCSKNVEVPWEERRNIFQKTPKQVQLQGSRVRPNFSMVRLIKNTWLHRCDQVFSRKKKVSATLKVSVCSTTDTHYAHVVF